MAREARPLWPQPRLLCFTDRTCRAAAAVDPSLREREWEDIVGPVSTEACPIVGTWQLEDFFKLIATVTK